MAMTSAGPYANDPNLYFAPSEPFITPTQFSMDWVLFWMPNQQCLSIESKQTHTRPFNGPEWSQIEQS